MIRDIISCKFGLLLRSTALIEIIDKLDLLNLIVAILAVSKTLPLLKLNLFTEKDFNDNTN